MSHKIDLSNQTFGLLRVIKRIKGPKWLCICSCGTKTIVHGYNLKNGNTRGCGCTRGRKPSHGLTKSRTYESWQKMKSRCDNPKTTQYQWYGGKGIKYSKRWTKFENFLADMGERPMKTTLDRINPHKNYTPSNCRWMSLKYTRQRRSPLIGDKTLMQISKETGIRYHTLYARYRKNK